MITAVPSPTVAPADQTHYAGFWLRVAASVVDTVLVVVATAPLLLAVYGPDYYSAASEDMILGAADFLITWVLPAVAVIVFWITRQATPGKMLLGLRVVDARSGGPLTVGQSIGRYLSYYLSLFPLGLGFLWVVFDARKQGWHDKLAGTVVVRDSVKRAP